MSDLLEGVRGAVLASGEGARRARAILAGMGATLIDDPAGGDFAILDSSADVDALVAASPGLVVVAVREEGGVPAISALETVAAVVTGLRQAARTFAGQRIDLDARGAALAAAGESLMVARGAAQPGDGSPG